jgi:hypothetical protein
MLSGKLPFHFAHQLSGMLTLLEPFHKVIFMEAVPLCNRVLLHWIRLLETVCFAGKKALNLPSATKPLTHETR